MGGSPDPITILSSQHAWEKINSLLLSAVVCLCSFAPPSHRTEVKLGRRSSTSRDIRRI